MNDFKDLLQKYKNDLIENGYEENIKTETIDIIEETNAGITKDSKKYKESDKCIFKQDISYENAERLVMAIKRYKEYSLYNLSEYKDQVYQEALFCFERCENPIEMLVYSIREVTEKMYINLLQDIVKDFINDYRTEVVKAYENILNNWIWEDCIEFVLNSVKLNFLQELQEPLYNLFVKSYSLRVAVADTLIDIEAKEKFTSMVNFLVVNTSDSREETGIMKDIVYRLGKNSEFGSVAIYKIYLNVRVRGNIKTLLMLGIRNNLRSEIYNDIEKKLYNKQIERWVHNQLVDLLNYTDKNPKSQELLEKCKTIAHIDKGRINVNGIDELKEVITNKSADKHSRKEAIIKLIRMQEETNEEKIKIIESVYSESDSLRITAASALTQLGRINELKTLFKYLVGSSDVELADDALNQIRRLKSIRDNNVNNALTSVISRFMENDEAKNTSRVLTILHIYSTGMPNEEITGVFLKKLSTTSHEKIKVRLLEFFSKNYSILPNCEKDKIKQEITRLTLDDTVAQNAMESLKKINMSSSNLPESIS